MTPQNQETEMKHILVTCPPMLGQINRFILGTQNGSNSVDAVIRASHQAIDRMAGFLTGLQKA